MCSVNIINSAVLKALYNTQIQTIDALLTFFLEKYGDDIDIDFMNEVITTFKIKLHEDYTISNNSFELLEQHKKNKINKKITNDTIKLSEIVNSNTNKDLKKYKKKRAPSAYTMFIKHKMSLLKKEQPSETKGTILMKLASEAWKSLSDDKINELKTKFSSIIENNKDVEEKDSLKLTRIAKELYDSVFGEVINIKKYNKTSDYEGVISDDSDE